MIEKNSNEQVPEFNWKDKVILVAEDVDTSNLFFKMALKKTEASVLWANNGQEAVDYCKTDQKIDLILLDLKMPKMDGLDALKIIKEIRKETPVIVQTAYVTQREASFENGCDEFLPKPIKLKTLLTTISRYIEG